VDRQNTGVTIGSPLLLAAIIATLSCLPGAWRLYSTLSTDFELLLPRTAPSVLDLKKVSQRIESTDNLAILIDAEPGVSRAFSQALDKTLAPGRRPPPDIQGFLNRYGALYLTNQDLIRVENSIRSRLSYERELYNPLHIFSGIELVEPEIYDPRTALAKKLSEKGLDTSSSTAAALASKDGRTHAILMELPGSISDINAIARLKVRVDESIRNLRARTEFRDEKIDIHFTGGVQNTWEEHEGILEDLGTTTLGVVILVIAALGVFLGSARMILAILLGLGAAVIWTFGLANLWTDQLNANSAFLGSIIVGNGINPGIILAARFLELRSGSSHPTFELVRTAVRATWRPTLIASLCAGAAYGALLNTDFRGFKQFGSIGLTGMLLSWIAAMTVQPVLMTLLFAQRASAKISASHSRKFRPSGNPKLPLSFIPILSIGMAIGSLLYTLDASLESRLETDLTHLRSSRSFESGSGYWSKKLDEISGRYLSPMAVLAPNRSMAEEVALRLRASGLKSGTQDPFFRNVHSLGKLLPGTAAQIRKKQEILGRIRKLLPPWKVARLGKSDRRRLEPLLSPNLARPWNMEHFTESLPEAILKFFREKDGALGRIVWVEPPLTSVNFSPSELNNWVTGLRAIAKSVSQEALIAGPFILTRDLLEGVKVDGPRSSVTATFLVLGIIALLTFRHPSRGLFMAVTLALGLFWLGGWVSAAGIKLHFLNFIAIPITLGIGADYGINIIDRLPPVDGSNSIASGLANTRRAVILCSLTTLIGYGSLLFADNRALRSFGLICVLGELTCLTAATVSLPSIHRWISELRIGFSARKVMKDQAHAKRVDHTPKLIEHVMMIEVDGRKHHAPEVNGADQTKASQAQRIQQRKRRIRHMQRRHRTKNIS
jgi:predicted RND superfamily exporter protein